MFDSVISQLKSDLDQIKGKRDSLIEHVQKVTCDISGLELEATNLSLVTELFRKLIDTEVNLGIKAVERLQTEGLQAVFDDQDLRVKAQVETSRGKVSVDLVTIQKYADGVDIEGLSSDSFGGSVSTVQSILLRLVIVLRQGLYPILLLDESLPAFDDNYIVNMGRFLSTLCSRLGMDILLVTHNPELVNAADRVYRINKKDGVAEFQLVRGQHEN